MNARAPDVRGGWVTVSLASVLITAAVLRSQLMPLCLVTLMGALVGLLVATQRKEPRSLVQTPLQVAGVALVLVGVGQLGVLGIILGVGLLMTAPRRSLSTKVARHDRSTNTDQAV
jgi:hypothetical protein